MSEIEIRRQDVEQAAEPVQLLTVEQEVARRLAEIHAVQDDEAAHSLSDSLYRDVLATIAAGASDAPVLAAAALRLETLDFARWCA